MEATLDNSVVIDALRNLRRQYEDVYNRAYAWMQDNMAEYKTETYILIQTLSRYADEGIGRCNMNLRLLGEQE